MLKSSGGRVGGGRTGGFRGQGAGEANPVPFGPVVIPTSSPLLKSVPHACIPLLEKDFHQIKQNHTTSDFPLIASHCKIVYIYRNIKDVMVSYYEFVRGVYNVSVEDTPFEVLFDEFCEGIMARGPYWDHILEYWKASQERPERFLFLKYEDMKRDSVSNVKRITEFVGCPFSVEEEEEGVVENIIKLCNFENLKNLQVNKNGKHRSDVFPIEIKLYFRKAEDGDWENYFTEEMIEKIDKLIDQKLGNTGLILK